MKEFFLPLTEPVGAVWAVMAAGVVWLLCKRQWKGAVWLGSPTVVLFLLGSTPLIEGIVGREEGMVGRGQWVTDKGLRTTDHGPWTTDQRPKTADSSPPTTSQGPRTTDNGLQPGGDESPGSTVYGLRSTVPPGGPTVPVQGSPLVAPSIHSPGDAVLVLGGGVRMSEFDRFGFAPRDAFARIFSGIQLVREGRARTLVLGGSYPYPGKPELPSFLAVEDWMGQWGLTTAVVTNLGICYNTHDEALAFKSLYETQGWKSVILVTSALHMKRSVALFQKLGITVEPATADFEVYGVSQDSRFSIFPRLHRFRLWGLYLHEQVGWWVYAMKGWV